MEPQAHQQRLSRRSLLRWGGGGLVLAAAAALGYVTLLDDSGDSDRLGLVFTIPYGQSQYVNAGLESAVPIPTDIRFKPGEVAAITIINLDTVTHLAGPFLVGPGQTYTQRFPKPGQYPINCTINPVESIVVTVEEES